MNVSALLLLMLALTAHKLASTAAAASECSDAANKPLYTDTLALRSKCQSVVRFTLTPPLAAPRTRTICASCKELAAMTRAKRFGDCTLLDDATGTTTTLQAQMDALFGACSSMTSPSKSGSGSTDIDTPKPTTRAPVPTPTSAPPTSNEPSVPLPTTKTPAFATPTTPRPTATEPIGGGSGAIGSKGSDTNNNSNGSKSPSAGSLGGSLDNINARFDAASTIVYVVGIAAGVVLVVILVATAIVCRQRRQNRRRTAEPFEYADRSTPAAKSVPSGNSSRSGTSGVALPVGPNIGVRSSSMAFLNETFLQPHVGSGGLWDDDAIVAARVPREKVLAESLVSRGGYGEVYRGTYNNQVVAIKTLLPETRKSLKQIRAFLAEVKLMATLEHAQIVRFVGVAWDSLTDLCVLTEFMTGGDLRALLTKFEDVEHRRHGFDADKIKIALHVAHALTYLHSLRPVILHRDLKSKNILLDSQLNAKLTDFGVSRERSDTTTMTAGVGTSLWMAPEVMLGERYDEKSDIFSFGVVLSELDSHALPYAHAKESADSDHRIPDTAILQLVSLGRLTVQFSRHANKAVVALAQSCVSVDPSNRPTAADVLYTLHNVLKSY